MNSHALKTLLEYINIIFFWIFLFKSILILRKYVQLFKRFEP